MDNSSSKRQSVEAASPDTTGPRHRARLPRFIAPEPIGLGDAVKRMTTFAGIQPCGGCDQRAARMNRWLQFQPRR
jgi:hypothetical protein